MLTKKNILGYGLCDFGECITFSIVASAFLSVGNMMQWGLVGQAIGYNEALLGIRGEGTLYGIFNMLRRLGQAISASACVAVLGWIGYDAVASNQGLIQSGGVVLGIKVLCVLCPAILSLGSWVAFRFIWNTDLQRKENI